jgi:N-carbamoyl-L-amino-acid hydrolase
MLDKEGIPIGIVKGIVGIRRYAVIFLGVSNHTGTTPMPDRKDALVAAAAFILFVREVGLQHGIVATVGSAFIEPNAPNVIPGRVELTVDIRSLDKATLDAAENELRDYATQAGGSFAGIHSKAAVLSNPMLMDALREASADLGLPSVDMASGAGHDAMCMATLAPEAMLFVPSVNGISHSPDEYTSPEDCLNGARVLFTALLKLDERLDA